MPLDLDNPGAVFLGDGLPDPLPPDALPIFKSWFDEAAAKKVTPNPNAMALATIDPDGAPSSRVVLCKGMDIARGYIVFYTNYKGRKGRALAANPRAGVCFHWDSLERQVRIEGPVTVSPETESDAYFATRPLESQLGAWASEQGEPIASREALFEKAAIMMARFCDQPRENLSDLPVIPRPGHWGGFRLWAARVELWMGATGRMHDRAVWERPLESTVVDEVAGFAPAGPWKATRLQP